MGTWSKKVLDTGNGNLLVPSLRHAIAKQPFLPFKEG